MQIEPEALYGLFETLYLPNENSFELNKVEQIKEVKGVETPKEIMLLKAGLFMLFDKQITDDEKEFLHKILAAVNILPSDVEMIYNGNSEMVLQFIKEIKGHLILWGIDFNNIEKYKPKQGKETLVIITDKLSEIKSNQLLKTKLWNCLKEVFVKNNQ